MKSPAEQKNKSIAKNIIDLPSGAKAEMLPFKGKHVREAQRLSDGDETKVVFALIAVCTLIDEKKVTIEELDDIDGRDLLRLMAEYNGLF